MFYGVVIFVLFMSGKYFYDKINSQDGDGFPGMANIPGFGSSSSNNFQPLPGNDTGVDDEEGRAIEDSDEEDEDDEDILISSVCYTRNNSGEEGIGKN